ncbi:MAG TPA: hypothetical protein VNT79_14925, partial [Phycisphaerae bacterium]|nr:hypothetical protein [Phycisphaerae bacterium]
MPCTGWALPAAIIVGLAASRGALAVTITWTGGAATNSWHTPANWNLNRVPEPGDDVVIPNMAPDVNVTYSLGSTTINSLTSAEAFTLTSGQATTLTINAASTLNGTFALSATLAGAGDVTVNGAMNWTGFGTMSGTGRTIISSSGSLTISDTSPKTLSRTLENHSANASWTNGNMQMNNGTFSNASSGTLTVNVPTGLNFSGFGGTNAVTNAGTFNKIGPATVSTNTLVQFNNTGTVNVDGGELLIGGGGANAGVMDVDAGTNLRLLSGMTHSPTSTLIGLGTLTFGGTHNFAGTLQTDRIIYMPGGAIVHLNANY